MILKLKFKFVTLAMAALIVLMVVVVAAMNIINYISVVEESDMILSVLSENRGNFPQFNGGNNFGNRLPPNMSPETPYESRHFTVVIDEDGNVSNTNMSQIAAIDRATATQYAEKVLEKKNTKGFIGNYRYIANNELGNVRISFLDCGRRLDAFKSFLYISSGVALEDLLLCFLPYSFFQVELLSPLLKATINKSSLLPMQVTKLKHLLQS